MKQVSIQNRRVFISKAAAGILFFTGSRLMPDHMKRKTPGIKAVLFDGFALFDPHPVVILTEKMFPGMGQEITDNWRLKQFEYTWLRESARQYKNFEQVTEDALNYAVQKAGILISDSERFHLLNAYSSMDIWPDVLATLQRLRKNHIRIGILSNMTEKTLEGNIGHNKLAGYFDAVISTDRLKCYKPSPKAYQMGPDYLHLDKEELLFVSFAGWDASGASWFGYPTYWVNRLHAVKEELGNLPVSAHFNLENIKDFIR